MTTSALVRDDGFAIVPPGKVLDFINGTLRNDTPEEYVRQETLKSLVREYKYPKEDIAVEWPMRIGSRNVRADIAIFPSGTAPEARSQENVYLLVECKKPGTNESDRNDGVRQLQSYMAACPNVSVGMWTNGPTGGMKAYRSVIEGGKRRFPEIPDLPRYGADEEVDRPSFEQLRPAASASLLFAFRRSHDYISGNQGIHKEGAFWELLKLIFCKIDDERNSERPEFYATPDERGSALGQGRVKKRIAALFEHVKAEYPQIFKAADVIELQPPILAYIVTQLQMYSLLSSDVDVKGKAYEEIVGSNLRGDRGEFFTPRNVVHMMVAMTDPKEDQLVLDPACGTGGFLISAMNYVVDGIKEQVLASGRRPADRENAIRTRVQHFLSNNLVGLDFNPELVKATKMNMVMNNDGSGGLYQANSLAAPPTWADDLRNRKLIGSVDVVLTNPPFGSKIPIDDPAILDQYELGHQWVYDEDEDTWSKRPETTSRPPEILFIERCVKFLKPGSGVAAMVLPDGILGSPGLGFVRQWLLDNTVILASVDLHPDTFQPGTSVQTSVLVVRRKSDEERRYMPDYPVFMAICDRIGHDKRGNTIYVRDDEGFEVVAEVEDAVTVDEDRVEEESFKTHARVVDDNTKEIADAFREWMSA
ncbi:N-6 DNA methylase [Cellulosimicrobium sp. MI9406]|uniref:restriction endonuclease subunit M n=1 Tax=Cellulosimicrobium sp. MI9406 TaxID=2931398 RepID=UPI0033B35585